MTKQASQIQEDWSLILKKLETNRTLQQALDQIETIDRLIVEEMGETNTETLKLPYSGAERIAEPRWRDVF